MRTATYKPRFRWVQCQLDHLQTLKRDTARRHAIDNLPPNLPKTYQRILERIGKVEDDLEVAKKALTWVIFCKRPLKLRELAVAIAIDPDDRHFDDSRKLDYDEQILEICSSFVKMDDRTSIVEVAHFSVVEYFTSRTLPGEKTQNPHFMDQISHNAELLNCCLAYLSFPQFEIGPCSTDAEVDERLEDNELLEYAAWNWPSHGEDVKTDTAHQQRVSEFFCNPCQQPFLAWEQIWQRKEMPFVRPNEPNSLCYALEFGYLDAVESLVGNAAPFDEATKVYSNAMLSAASIGDADTVQRLLNADADLSAQDKDGWSALSFAVHGGYVKIVRMLLDANADVSILDSDGWTALHFAASNGYDEIVKMLLDANADVSIQDNCGRTALRFAAMHDYDEIVKMLLDANGDI